MVSTVSKLANPWKCDAPGCGVLRAKDTNHWLILRFDEGRSLLRTSSGPSAEAAARAEFGEELLEYVSIANPSVVVSPWNDELAEKPGVKHVCGIDCGLKVAAQLIDEHLFGNRGKEVES